MPINQNDLFPYIHPLNRGLTVDQIIEAHPFLNDWRKSFVNHYGYILDKDYLNEEKMNGAIRFLIPEDNVDNIIDAIAGFIDKYEEREDLEKIRTLDIKDMSLFWVAETSAFILINVFIEDQSANNAIMITKCFGMARNLKDLWQDRSGRRTGGNAKKELYALAEQQMLEIWLDFPLDRRKDTNRSYFWLSKETNNPFNLKERTIKRHIRKWHKIYFPKK